MKRFLVTGGAGFIGSHIVHRLVEEGHFVRVLDDFSSGTEENLKGVFQKIELIRDDIRNKNACKKAAENVDFILHQAALRSVPKSLKDPDAYNEVNIQGTLNLLQAAVEQKVKVLVFASSSSVYGATKKFPEKETFFPELISPYALSKLTGEYYCKIFSYHYNLATVSLRYFNVFGPRQSLDDEYAVVIPKFIHCILNDQPPPIYGTGKQSRDFTYVDNVVAANLSATELTNSKGEVFNVATGRDCTVLSLVDKLNKLTGKQIKPVFLPLRAGDVFRTLADVSKTKKKLGLRRMVNFDEGLSITLEYFKEKWQKK